MGLFYNAPEPTWGQCAKKDVLVLKQTTATHLSILCFRSNLSLASMSETEGTLSAAVCMSSDRQHTMHQRQNNLLTISWQRYSTKLAFDGLLSTVWWPIFRYDRYTDIHDKHKSWSAAAGIHRQLSWQDWLVGVEFNARPTRHNIGHFRGGTIGIDLQGMGLGQPRSNWRLKQWQDKLKLNCQIAASVTTAHLTTRATH